MKRIAFLSITIFLVSIMYAQEKKAETDSFYTLSPVEVKAIRATDRAPVTKTNLSKKEIEKQNLGQDLPFILNQTPSVIINSDAGNGVGYTGIRIRGADATRINVTVNGIPYNDAESQGSFFVDLPDFTSSVSSIQIQRGVGSSSNGAGAFGATINLSTNEINKNFYTEFNNSYGSFNTWKNTLKVGTGLLADRFTVDFRLSGLTSDGYIDRAGTKLHSFYISAAYIAKRNSFRLNVFQGKEKTYQAWYGISETDLKAGNRTINYAGTEKPGEPYDNETDNYKQDHYQLFYAHHFNDHLSFNTALFLTKGKGYYEQYKADEAYDKYHLPNKVIGTDTLFASDFIRQLWLDNDYYGNIFSLQYQRNETEFTLGGGVTNYLGNHFGELTWALYGLTGPGRWYDLDAQKKDINTYAKLLQKFSNKWNGYLDLQFRHVSYDINGFRDHPDLEINNRYNFFNPKFGISYRDDGWNGYLSYNIANKEPNRDDFEAGINEVPKHEQLHDIELGIERIKQKWQWGATIYHMRYKNQLVLTGEINDVGAYTRTNIPASYRLGVELQGSAIIQPWLNLAGNFSVSKNKVEDFKEYIDDYDNGGQKLNEYRSTDIAYSPNIVSAASINFLPLKKLEISLLSKYAGKQYLDNTSNENRKLNAFYLQDIRTIYSFHKGRIKEGKLILQLNNVFNKKYEPNGYTFSYIYGGELVTENYYFPMAGRNVMVALNLKF